MAIAGDSSLLTDDSLECLDLSHLFITSNGSSIEEETIDNPLNVLGLTRLHIQFILSIAYQ